MDQYYDERLGEILSTNNDNDCVDFNGNFSSWRSTIESRLRGLSDSDYFYESSSNRRLLAACRDHASAFQKDKRGENAILFVHPLYLHLTHMHELDTPGFREEADDYLNKFFSLINLNGERNVNFVLLDTAHHYAAASSLLMESGLVDRIIFTESNRGNPLDTSEIQTVGSADLFFVGGYNGRCLTSAIKSARNYFPEQRVWAIADLVLDSPQDRCDSLIPSSVSWIDDPMVVPLKEVSRRLELSV